MRSCPSNATSSSSRHCPPGYWRGTDVPPRRTDSLDERVAAVLRSTRANRGEEGGTTRSARPLPHGGWPAMTPRKAAVAVFTALTMAGCDNTGGSSSGDHTAAAHPATAAAPAVAPPATLPACTHQPSAAEVRAAMLSVYYSAYLNEHPTPHTWQPIPLPDAIPILNCDTSFGASSRRRR